MTGRTTAFRILRPEGTSRFVLVCDHASNRIPPELGRLGLPLFELARHIAWDIGAAGVTEALSEILDAPAVLSTVSRLVIDANRQVNAPSLIPETSDGTRIPGNLRLNDSERRARIDAWFAPYHDAIETLLLTRQAAGLESILLSIHSMTPSLGGVPRPWTIALSSHLDRRLADPMLVALRGQDENSGDESIVGDNEPYRVDPNVDYSTPVHAIRRGWPHLQVEFRQDQIAEADTQRQWALRFARALDVAVPRRIEPLS